MLLDALGDRFLDAPRPISREPYGRGSIAGFSVTESAAVAYGDERAEGTATTTWYVDTSQRPVETETGLVLGDPERPKARIWLHPADPRLPALAPASFEESARALLERLGIQLASPPDLVTYRAGKRAVFRMVGSHGTTYLKVVRPSAVAELAAVHTALADAGLPVPRVIAWGEIGLLVIPMAEGDAMSRSISESDPEALLDGLDAMRSRLGQVDLGRPARAPLTDRADWYVERVRAGAAGDAAVLQPAEAVIAELGDPIDSGRRQTIHGDLHVGQLFVEGTTVSSLIDVDTAGHGNPVDDEAAYLGHLAATAAMRAKAGWPSEPVTQLAVAGWRRWQAAGDPAELRRAVLVHVLGHALLPGERGDWVLANDILMRGLQLVT